MKLQTLLERFGEKGINIVPFSLFFSYDLY